MRLTSDILANARGLVVTSSDSRVATRGRQQACREVLHELSLAQAGADGRSVMERFFQIVWLLQNCEEPALLSGRTLEDLTRMAEYALRVMGIKPYSSQLSYLYRDLYHAKSKLLARMDQPWDAAWCLTLAEVMTGNQEGRGALDADFATTMLKAEHYQALGHTAEALEAFQKADELAKDDADIGTARLGTIRCLRIFNELLSTRKLIDGTLSQLQLPEPLRLSFIWEKALTLAQAEGDNTALLQLIGSRKKDNHIEDQSELLSALLWCYAAKQKATLDDLPSSTWLKRRLPQTSIKTHAEKLKYLQVLENCYATKDTISEKLKDLGEFLGSTRNNPPTGDRCIFLAAVARWLFRVKQKSAAKLVIAEYRQVSHLLSEGKSEGLYSLLSDIGDRLSSVGESTRAISSERNVKTGLERSFLYVEMFAKVILTVIATKTGQWLGGKSLSDARHELMINLSQYFVQYASGAMKGPIHKFAQIVLNMVDLPEEAVLNFQKVLWSRQVVPFKNMRKVFEDDTQKTIEDVFAEFNTDPIGVGSVSQVYRARLKTGELVAVKIQYPDLDKIARQDLAIGARIFSAGQRLLPRADVFGIIKVIEEMALQELDFRNELSTYEALQSIVASGASWRIPKVYKDLVTTKVLVADYIEGLNFYQFMEQADDADKLKAAMTLSEFGHFIIGKGHMACLDPHPANFIFKEGEIYFVDFGFFFPVQDEFVSSFKRLLNASFASDAEGMLDQQMAIYTEGGQIVPHPSVPMADVRECLRTLVAQFHWERTRESNLRERYHELYFKKGVNKVLGTPIPEVFITYLAHAQLVRTISRLGVPQPEDWTRVMAQALNDYDQRLRQAEPAPMAAETSISA